MRIANNIMALNTHKSYTQNNDKVAKAAEKLSSGYKVNRAGDDAAGLAISEKMRAQIRGLSMAKKNSQDAVSLVQTAEGALQEVHSMLQRMNELAVQSATGTNDDSIDRNALNLEFSQLKDEIDQVAGTTTFNNINLMNSPTTFTIQVGAEASQSLDITMSQMTTAGLSVNGNDISSATNAGSAITATRAAINTVSTQRATLGAMQNRLEYKINNLANTIENLTSAESRIRDIDIASEMTNFTKNNILSQAATAMLAQGNAQPQNVLSLLR